MRQLLYILSFILIISCNNAPEKDLLNEIEAVEKALENEVDPKSEAFEYATITEQKLQEYADLSVLKYQYPEFAEIINKQMQDYSKDSLPWSTTRDSIGIKVLSKIGSIEKINDSLKRITIQYSGGSITEYGVDTIVAVIKTKRTTIDGKDVDEVKVTFQKN